jgi:hypothetical protein
MKPNGRDYTTDPVLKRLANSDHATLILARRLQARSPFTEGFQIIDVYGDDRDDGGNQGHISDVSVSRTEPDDTGTVPAIGRGTAPPTEEQQVSTAPASEGNVETLVLVEPQPQGTDEVAQAQTTEGQQQEGAEAVTEEAEDQEQTEEMQVALERSLGVARKGGDDDDDDDDSPAQKFKCTVPGCNKSFSEHHELKGTSSYIGTR